MAFRIGGATTLRTISRHMVTNFNHLIATTALAVPSMIVAELSPGFLGLGLRLPAVRSSCLCGASRRTL